jgi:polyvinyl alcohol dehydrogenase (cytochrome)
MSRIAPWQVIVGFAIWSAAAQAADPGPAPNRFRVNPAAGPQAGAAIYERACGGCHDGAGGARAPGFTTLSAMSARAVLAALESGRMRAEGATLSPAERRDVAEWLSGQPLTATTLPESAYCADRERPLAAAAATDSSGWGGHPEASGFRDARQAGLTVEELPRLELKWAFGFAGASQSRSKPAVSGDRVFVGSPFGELYSLDLDRGCVYWIFPADGAIRGAVLVGAGPGDRRTVYAVDFRTNAYSVDAASGKLLWKTRTGSHPDASNTGSPVLYEDTLYVPLSSMESATVLDLAYECCHTSGEVVALDARTGAIKWRYRAITEPATQASRSITGAPMVGPSGVPVWSSPTVDPARGRLYIGTGENYSAPATANSDAVVALDLGTGEPIWSHQGTAGDTWNLACEYPDRMRNCPTPIGPDFDFGMAPILLSMTDGTELLLAGQKSGTVWALDPDRGGAVRWASRIGRGGLNGGIHWGMAGDAARVYAPNSDKDKTRDSDDPPRPGLYALDLATGAVVWKYLPDPRVCDGRPQCLLGFSAAPTAIPGAVLQGGLDGHLRAHAAADGRVLWEFDAARPFETVNGITARGGAFAGPGPVIAAGAVLAMSGYDQFGLMPGNVLLAFAVPSK